ncbi:hypothetical protein D9M70_549060 [compost metagenome]
MRLSTSRRVRDVVGSSMMTSLARVAMARAIATSWREASGRSETMVLRKPRSVGRPVAASARSAVSLNRFRSKRRARRPLAFTNCSFSATFSATVRFGSSDRSW